MATSGREARRKKILDRGSDRLALITGRLDALSPSSDSQSQESLPDLPTAPLKSHLSDQIIASPVDEDKTSTRMLPKHDSGSEASVGTENTGARVEPQLGKLATDTGALRFIPSEVSRINQACASTSTVRNFTPKHKFFSPNKIISAIRASENTRIFCCLAIALFGLLSHGGFPFLSGSLIFSRPLLLVLLTDFTIVIGRILSEKQRSLGSADTVTRGHGTEDEYGWAEQASKALEVGLVLQKVIDGIFMDCSVYSIVVVCGLSLSSKFCV